MGGNDEYIDIEHKELIKKEIRKRYLISEDDFLIITGGKIDKEKNIDLLLKAVVELNISNLKLAFFGKPNRKGLLTPQKVLKSIDEIIKGDAIVTTDVGQHQMWSALHLTFKNHNLISSGGGGTMGFGLPSAIGAQIAFPNKKVLAIVGDGGVQMNIQELMLLKKYKLPIKVFIMNNSYLGMVRQWQELFHEKRYSSVNLDDNPDFMLLAQAYGIKGVTLKNEMDLEKLDEIINLNEPVLINCIVVGEENVFPMIPAGKSVDDMIGMRGVRDDEKI